MCNFTDNSTSAIDIRVRSTSNFHSEQKLGVFKLVSSKVFSIVCSDLKQIKRFVKTSMSDVGLLINQAIDSDFKSYYVD